MTSRRTHSRDPMIGMSGSSEACHGGLPGDEVEEDPGGQDVIYMVTQKGGNKKARPFLELLEPSFLIPPFWGHLVQNIIVPYSACHTSNAGITILLLHICT